MQAYIKLSKSTNPYKDVQAFTQHNKTYKHTYMEEPKVDKGKPKYQADEAQK